MLRNPAVRSNDERLSFGNSHAKHLGLDAIRVRSLTFVIRKQRERQAVILGKLLM